MLPAKTATFVSWFEVSGAGAVVVPGSLSPGAFPAGEGFRC
jgi:hypothetical protein